MAIGIDWSSASVDGGRLTVPLSGRASSEWQDRLAQVADRLMTDVLRSFADDHD